MKPKKLTRTIILTLLLAVIGSITVTGTISIFYSNQILKKEIEQKNSLLVKSIASQITEYIEMTYSDVISFSKILDYGNLSRDRNQYYMDMFIKGHQRILSISDIHLINKKGIITHTSPDNRHILGTDVSKMNYYDSTMRLRKPYWSPSEIHHHGEKPTVTLGVPMKGGIIAVHLALWNLKDVIKELTAETKGIICIIDQQGTYIVHTDPRHVFERRIDANHLILRQMASNKLRIQNLIYYGNPVISFSQFIPSTGWVVNIYQSESEIYNAAQTLTTFFLTSFFIILALVILISYYQLNSIKINMNRLLDFIQSISKRRYASVPPTSSYKEFDELAQQFHSMSKTVESREKQLKENEEIISHSLHEKETLLKEIHHRVKNNMQIISSFLEMQKDGLKGRELDAFQESQNRIQAMAFIHEQIYQSNQLSRVEFRDFTENMIHYYESTMHMANSNIEFSNKIKNIHLQLEQAIPCALILNELVTNSIKHAFTEDGEGEITINFSNNKEDQTYTLQVMDNGVGIAENDDNLLNKKTLGINLLHALTKQLDGTIISKTEEGVDVSITFPYDEK